MIHLHEAIYALNASVASVRGEEAFDKNGNPVEYDLEAAKAKFAEAQDSEKTKKAAALEKLVALGLTPDDLKRILG